MDADCVVIFSSSNKVITYKNRESENVKAREFRYNIVLWGYMWLINNTSVKWVELDIEIFSKERTVIDKTKQNLRLN